MDEMLILYGVKWTHQYPIIDIIKRSLSAEGLPYYWITEDFLV
ncbi:hypothetical protein [Bacillus sp. EB600]|nr:hypothetical protein [Bacillus sp. EB600]